MKTITTFDEFKTKTMLRLLEEAVERVKAGEVSGLLLTLKLGERHHGIGLLGEYLDDPAQVLTVTGRIEYRLNQLIDERLRRPKPGKALDFENR